MKQNKFLISILGSLIFLFSTTVAQAAEFPTSDRGKDERVLHETTGVVGGAVIGGVLGGPVGAVVAAAFGSWVSDLTLTKKENSLIAASLDERDRDLLALQAEYRSLQARYQVAAREARSAGLRNASLEARQLTFNPENSLGGCCKDTELALHFKTNSDWVEPLYESKLAEFADLVEEYPETVIKLTGHADRRGDSTDNLALSQRRIQAVENKLLSLGVTKSALQTSAFGESRPVTESDTLENNFFDRRVVLKIITPESDYLTQTTD